jgi:hypothetical protein
MGQVLHGSATTTEAVRRAIQNSQESLRALSKRYGINQKTVAKWKHRNLPPSQLIETVLIHKSLSHFVALSGLSVVACHATAVTV